MDQTIKDLDLDLAQLQMAEETTGLMRTDVKDEVYFILDSNRDADVKEVLQNEFGNELVTLFDEWINLCVESWSNLNENKYS